MAKLPSAWQRFAPALPLAAHEQLRSESQQLQSCQKISMLCNITGRAAGAICPLQNQKLLSEVRVPGDSPDS